MEHVQCSNNKNYNIFLKICSILSTTKDEENYKPVGIQKFLVLMRKGLFHGRSCNEHLLQEKLTVLSPVEMKNWQRRAWFVLRSRKGQVHSARLWLERPKRKPLKKSLGSETRQREKWRVCLGFGGGGTPHFFLDLLFCSVLSWKGCYKSIQNTIVIFIAMLVVFIKCKLFTFS